MHIGPMAGLLALAVFDIIDNSSQMIGKHMPFACGLSGFAEYDRQAAVLVTPQALTCTMTLRTQPDFPFQTQAAMSLSSSPAVTISACTHTMHAQKA